MEKSYIKGKFKKLIYQNEESNFIVALFKVSETNDLEVSKYSSKLIYVTGIIYDIRYDMEYIIYGKLSFHQKYSWQYTIERFKVLEPTTEEEIQADAEKLVKLFNVNNQGLINKAPQASTNKANAEDGVTKYFKEMNPNLKL